MTKVVAIDSETLGVDFKHGALPFYVTSCFEDNNQKWWDWPVDPLTRKPQIPDSDLDEIIELIQTADQLVGQNLKFDISALDSIGIWDHVNVEEVWRKTNDTLVASHILASSQPHNLTSLGVQYLRVDIEPFEKVLKEACLVARRMARSKYKDWAIAKEGRPDMPSAKGGKGKESRGGESESPWKFDSWLPKALAVEQQLPTPDPECDHNWQPDWYCSKCGGHRWWLVLQEYSNADSAVTLPLWQVLEKKLKQQDLWEIYLEQMKMPPVLWKMERHGVTMNKVNADKLIKQFGEESEKAGRICVNLASSYGYDLELPKGASPNNSLRHFCFGKPILNEDKEVVGKTEYLKLPVVSRSDSGAPSLDKEAIEEYLRVLEPRSKQLFFIQTLAGKRKRDTALSYLESYQKFWLPTDHPDFMVLYPSINQTGTDTLRMSCSNPNAQQISKKDEVNLRFGFGPRPGREWWSLDYFNLERVLPVYRADEKQIISLFERPNDPPYYGSEHLLVAHILWPKEFEDCLNEKGELDGRIFKERYKSTLYQWTKNFQFASQYQCQERKGDATAHQKGAWAKVRSRFTNQTQLNNYYVRFADQNGYVETFPDKTVNPRRGYPIMCSRTEYGKISPTIPLSYAIQSTASWCMRKSMPRCQAQLDQWENEDGFDGKIVLTVHDELDFDFPAGGKANFWRVERMKKLMEQSGDDIGIPLRVSVSYHPNNWKDEEKLV